MDAQGPPPGPWAKNGEPILDRKGDPIQRKARQRVLLPVCVPCNSALNERFEAPAKDVVGALALNAWAGSYGAAEWYAVGMWWAKVLMMLGHAEARIGDSLLNREARLDFDGPMPDYTWMVDGSGPPDDLSVYVFNADLATAHEEFRLVVPAAVNYDDGRHAHCHSLSLATRGICVTVLSHPGIGIEHPMIKRGEAWELLHSPPDNADLSTLPRRSYRYVTMTLGGGVPAGHVIDEN